MRSFRSFTAAALVAAALVAVAGQVALAAAPTATVSWTQPETYEDGTTLPGSDLAYYTVSACRPGPSQCVTFRTAAVTAGTAPPLSLVIPLSCGNYSIMVSATTTASAYAPNATSGESAAVPFASGVTCSPNAPAGVTVTAGGTLPGAG